MQHDQLDDKIFIADMEKKMQQNLNQYTCKEIDSIRLINKHNRVLVPKAMQNQLLKIYQETLVHLDIDKQLNTMKSIFTWPKMRDNIKYNINHCHQYEIGEKAN